MKWFFLLFCLPLSLSAQEETVIEADYISIEKEGELSVAFLSYPVVSRGNIRIQADRMILWFPREKDTASFEELYAEGNVVYRSRMQEVKSNRMYYHAAKQLAYMVHLEARMWEPKSGHSYRLIAEKIKSMARGKFQMENIRLSTCNYGVPHYDVYIGEGRWTGRDPHQDAKELEIFPFEQWTLQGRPIIPRIAEIPVFYLPALMLKSEWLKDFPLRSIRPEETSRFGWSVLTEWGLPLYKGRVDEWFSEENLDPEDDDRRWGDIGVKVDWREVRGWAGGVNLKWGWDHYYGYVESYFLYDEGRAGNDFDLKFSPLDRKERGRVRQFHRHDITDDWRYELELSWISDEDLLEEFFETEFKEGREQETSAYLRWISGTVGAYFWERHRINNFQSQLEYLPRTHFMALHQPVFSSFWDRLLFFQESDLAHLRYRFGADDSSEDERSWRADLYNEVVLPFGLSWISFSPYGAVRGTFWDQDATGDSDSRWIWSAGGRIRMDFHAIYDVVLESVGINRLRHLSHLEARYAYNIHATEQSSSLYAYDDTELIDEFEEVAFSLRNRLQTKIVSEEGSEEQTFEFLDLGVAAEYYPNPLRDTISFQATNYLSPFHWIPLSPSSLLAPYQKRHWSNIHWDLSLRFQNSVGLWGRGEYNPEDNQEEVREVSLSFSPLDELTLATGGVFIRDVTNAWSASLETALGEKWFCRATMQYDFDTEAFTEQRLVVGRDFHDFVVQGVFENDEGRDEQKFYITVVPKLMEKLWR